MANRRAQALAGAALGSMGLGAIVWALLREDEPQSESSPSAPAGSPPLDQRPGDSAALDRNIVLLLDRTLPGTIKSYDLLREWVIKDSAGVALTARRYQAAYASWLTEQVESGRLDAARAQQARDILNGLGLAAPIVGAAAQVVGTAVNAAASVPGIGSVITGVYKILQMFVEAAANSARAGKNLFSAPLLQASQPIFTGYKDGNYYCWDIPVWSFTAPMWVYQFKAASTAAAQQAWAPVFAAFERLATERPFGLSVGRAMIENGGSYSYSFNIRGTNDLSAAAVARQEVRTFEVWNPADISPTGPRGFDPANPWAWKVPGARASIYDQGLPPGAPPP